jgi:hypothetical protein
VHGRRTRQRIDSASESETELILTAKEEEEALKNAALSILPQNKVVQKLEEAVKKLDSVEEPMVY